MNTPPDSQRNHAWLRALRDLAAIPLGIFMVVHETLLAEPRDIVLYAGIFLVAGPGALRLLGK